MNVFQIQTEIKMSNSEPLFEAFPLLFVQRLETVEGGLAYYVFWTHEQADESAVADTLKSLCHILNGKHVSAADNLSLLVNIENMPVDFVTGHLTTWLDKIETTNGWEKIRKCGIITSSFISRTIMSIFNSDQRVSYYSSATTACEEVGIDCNLIL